MAEGERLLHWLAAHTGQARIVLGTRLAILSSLPQLRMIVIDEEHDPSYKQQEGLRYSARADGVIVTNNHVVQGGQEFMVVLSDRREFEARVLLAEARVAEKGADCAHAAIEMAHCLRALASRHKEPR